jgi:hypothetical protein
VYSDRTSFAFLRGERLKRNGPIGIREPRSFLALHGRIRIAQLKHGHRVEKPRGNWEVRVVDQAIHDCKRNFPTRLRYMVDVVLHLIAQTTN